jgi:HEAT repeat protein
LRKTPYVDRLIHALNHPESEARMAAVIGLGRLAAQAAVSPLLALLERWPADVVQGGEAIQSLRRIGTDAAKNGLQQVAATHPSRVIRHLAERALNTALNAREADH